MLKGSLNNYVVSSRVRLARNIDGYKFLPKIMKGDARQLVSKLSDIITKKLGGEVKILNQMPETEIGILKERHLISNSLIKYREASAVILSKDEHMSVMLCEEDHIRIQAIYNGLELESAFELADKIDRELSKEAKYIFDPRLGYITTCPSNLGTGMRASVMMFLPALILKNTINILFSHKEMQNMTFRGQYGEGTNAEGFMYQLSNKFSLGLTENEILESVKRCVDTIARAEENAREAMFKADPTAIKDKVYRAWGTLTNAYKISSSEFLSDISYVKLGLSLGLLSVTKPEKIDELIINCQPYSISKLKGVTHDPVERDVKRAEYLKEVLTGLGRII